MRPNEAKNEANNSEEESEDGDYEWEYFYEDAEMKPKPDVKPTKPEVNPAKPEVKPTRPENEPKAQGAAGKTQRVNPRDGWECPTCTLLNEPHRPGCEACTTERPKDYQIPPPGPLDTIPRGAGAAAPAPVPPPPTGPPPALPGTSKKKEKEVKAAETVTKEKDDILKNFQKLDELDIIPNAEEFECIICYLDVEPGDGVVLRECLHTFCK